MATRRERVVLTLDDDFTSGMARAAGATALLNRELNSLSGNSVQASRSSQTFIRDVQSISRESRGAERSINQLTGRLRLFADAAAIFGPGTVPVGGVLAAGVAGFASQLGFAAVAGGVLAGSMQGLGDALGAMNKAQLEPTEKNLQAAEEALKRLSPATRDFAEQLFDLKPALAAIRDIGAEALMPGLSEAFDNIERLGPQVATIFQSVAGALGEIAADGAASLASDRWADFFDMIASDAPQALSDMASALGDITHGLSEMWEAFGPLNSDFSGWLVDVANGFDSWATGLSATEGFTEFVDYIRTTGPQVAETAGALAGAIVQIVQASAPLGGPILAGVEAFADAVSAIADSDLGTPIMAGVAALALLNRSLAVTSALSKTTLSGGMFAGIGTASGGLKKQAGSIRSDIADMSDGLVAFGSNADKASAATDRMKKRLAGGAGLAGLGIIATGAADGIGLTNTASLALMGTLGGPPGVAIGAAAGALLDLSAAGDGATASIDALAATAQSGNIEALRAQLADANKEFADLTSTDWSSIRDIGGDAIAGLSNGLNGVDKSAEKINDAERALKKLAAAEGVADSQARGAALAFLAQTDANVDLGKWAGKSTEQIKAQADAILESREAAQKTAESFINLGESLNDGKVSLGDWIKEMADSADALNNFTANSRKAAKRGLDDGLIASLQNAGEEGARRMRQLANGTKGSIDDANAAFKKGEKAIERYNNYKVPPKRVTADTSRAMQSFREVDTYLSSLNGKTATTYVNTVRTVTGPQGAAVFGQRADGGSVPKDNGPYRDKFLFMLAPGEEVISNRNGQADQFRADRAAGRIPGYADGGTTGRKGDKRKPQGGLFAADNTSALQDAIDRLTMVSEDQTRALDDATAKQEFWASKMSDLAQATVAGFNTGLFEKSDNPWAAGASGGPLGNLAKDIAGLQERSGLQSQLAESGLSGDALSALLSEGTNSDISALLNSGQVSQYADLYNQRAALQGSVGASAGQQAYGAEASAAQATVRVLEAGLRETNLQVLRMSQKLDLTNELLAEVGNDFGAQLSGSAAKGHRDNKARGKRR